MNNTENRDKAICIGIYAGTAAFGKKKGNWIPLIGVAALHAVEYATVGRKIGKAAGVSELKAAANCMLYGIAWWKPLKEELEAKGKEAAILEDLAAEGFEPENKFPNKGCGIRFEGSTEEVNI